MAHRPSRPRPEGAPEVGWRPAERFYLEPDFLIVPRSIVPPEFPGTDVLLAIEIADTSFDCDTGIKRERYGGLAVPEYRVVHAWDLVTRVYREPSAQGYRQVEEHPATALVQAALVPEVALRLADLGVG